MANTNHNLNIQPVLPTEIMQNGDLDNGLLFTGIDFNLLGTPVGIYTVYDNGQKLTVGEDFDLVGPLVQFYIPRDNDLITVHYKHF